MNLINILIGVFIVAVCVLPIVSVVKKMKKQERKTLQLLAKIADRHQCIVHKHEICGDYIIGIDEYKKVVFFLKLLNDKTIEKHISLKEIRSCRVKNTTRSVSLKKENSIVTDKLELIFIPISGNLSEISLEFYNSDNSSQLRGELQSIQRWSDVINNLFLNKT